MGPAVQIVRGHNGHEFSSNPAPRRYRPSELRKFAKPYESPALDVQEPARFSGDAPVQFDKVPVVFNPITSRYEPLSFQPSFTNVPREYAYDWWFGIANKYLQVDTDDDGNPIYSVDIYPYPGASKEDTVNVTLWGVDKLYPVDIGHEFWPIYQNPVDGKFYVYPSDCNTCLAKITTKVTERVGSTLGTGKAQLYTLNTPNAAAIAGTRGNVTVFSISGHPAVGADGTVAVGTWVILQRQAGGWLIVAADCSGAA